MDRRSWLWRRKSSDKSPGLGETESSGGSISSHSERFSDDQVYLNPNSQSHEISSKFDPRPNEQSHEMKTLSEKLSEALENIKAKEHLVNQHAKVAEEAVSGWEKAESEVLALRQQVEALTARNSTLEERVVHLDGALKECLRQLRQTREEKDQIAHEALEKKISETESCLTSIDGELHHKLEMAEKENSDLKLELSSVAEELEMRIIEKELSNQAAEQASKQHLDNMKKVAKLEAECRRLTSALQKANGQQLKACKKPSGIENAGFEVCGFGRNRMDTVVDIGLMDDFLEMERLVALPESSNVEEKSKNSVSLEIILKEHENELTISRKQLAEADSKVADLENELNISRNRFEEAESKMAELENELKASQSQLKESESKFIKSENELKISLSRLEEFESKVAKSENELKVSRDRLERAESNLADHENKLKNTVNLLEESESKLADRESELKESRNRLEQAECKLAEHENELKLSKDRLEVSESKLAKCKNELKAMRKRLEESETKLAERENELKASRYLLEDAESKLADRKNEPKIPRYRLKEAESKLAERENELKASRYRLEEAESKLSEYENELKTSRYRLEETESKLAETESHLEMTETGLEAIYAKKEETEARCKALEAELKNILPKVESLEKDVQKKHNSLHKAEAKCRELEDVISRLQNIVHCTKSEILPKELQFLKVKQETGLSIAASKFAACQKTIASLDRQLKAFAALDDLLIDTNDS